MARKGIGVSDKFLRVNAQWSLPPKGQEVDVEFGKCNFYTYRKDGAAPQYIVHTYSVGDFDKTIEKMIVPDGGDVAVLRGPGVSVHYVIDMDGTIYNMVPDLARAWIAGVGAFKSGSKLNPKLENDMRNAMNDYSIGIMCINDGKHSLTDLQHHASLELTKYLTNEYHIEQQNVLALADWTDRHIAPGPYFPWGNFAKHGLGAWPGEELFAANENVVVDWKNPVVEDIEGLRAQFEELGYVVPQGQELARAVRFNLHYRGPEILEKFKDVYDNMLWVDSNDLLAMQILGQWDGVSQSMLEGLL
jgi:N-acetyl-anhydromuramyl-L-alanine amidase AmpD